MKIYTTDDNDLAVIAMGEKWTIKDINFAFGCGMNRSRLLLRKAQRCKVLSTKKNDHNGWDVIGKYNYDLDTLVERNMSSV